MFSPPPEEFSSWPGSCQYIFVWSFALFILRMHPVSKRNKYCLYTKNNRRQSSREIITKLPDILTYYTTETDAPPTRTHNRHQQPGLDVLTQSFAHFLIIIHNPGSRVQQISQISKV